MQNIPINSPVRAAARGPAGETTRHTRAPLSHARASGDLDLPRTTTSGDEGLKARVARFERTLLTGALQRTAGNQSAAAELLQMPRRTLGYRIAALDVDPLAGPTETRVEAPGDDESLPYRDRVERFEIHLLQEALNNASGVPADAAKALGMTPKGFAYKTRKYGLA